MQKESQRNIIVSNELVQYIKDGSGKIVGGKKSGGRKIGAIKAIKLEDSEGVSKVFIVHSKVNTKKDAFDSDMMDHIIDQRILFMCDHIYDGKPRRRRKYSSYPKSLRKVYIDMLNRAKSYYKDVEDFYCYHDMFYYYDAPIKVGIKQKMDLSYDCNTSVIIENVVK